MQVQFRIGIPNAPGGVHVSSPYLSSLGSGEGAVCCPRLYEGGRSGKPPDQLAFVEGPQEGRCLIVLRTLLGALPADAPAEPGASSATKRAKVIHALWEGVHYSGLDRAILTGRTERRHLHPNL